MNTKGSNKESAFVPALDKSLNILEFLATQKSATIKEMVEALGIPSTTVFRIVKHFCARGYLDEETGEQLSYRLGSQIYTLYHGFVVGENHSDVSKEVLDKLSDECGQTAQYALLKKDGILYTMQSLPSQPVSIIAPLYTLVPINVSAAGKVLVGALPEKERAAYLAACTLAHPTEKSITNRTILARELEIAAAQGYATDTEEYALGIGCLAAPVYNYTGKVCAAIGITGSILSYNHELPRLINAVKDAAQDLSEKLGSNTNL